ncbi:MAG TPA: protein kinase [Pirellulales bacterium]|nr:protein kinase [Pirellulales bacterium]
MAPEQLFGGSHALSPAADIFSLGAVLYALFTGRALYDAHSVPELLEKRRSRLSFIDVSMPNEIAAIVARCLADDPRDRYGTAEELASSLRQND